MTGSLAHQQLRSFVDRVCRLNDEIKTLNGDKSEIYKEARANGFNPKVLKAAVKRFEQLKTNRHDVEEFDALFEMYMEALLGGGDERSNEDGTDLAIRACAHEAEPAHNPDTGELIEEETAPVSGADAGEQGAAASAVSTRASAAISIPAVAESAPAEAGQGEGRRFPSSLAPPMNAVAKATEVEPGNAGSLEGSVRLNNDRAGVASRLDSGRTEQGESASVLSPINSELSSPGWSTDPQINRGRCVEAGLRADRAQDGSISGDETTERLPGTTTEGAGCVPALPLVTRDGRERPAPISDDLDIPALLDRRPKVIAA